MIETFPSGESTGASGWVIPPVGVKSIDKGGLWKLGSNSCQWERWVTISEKTGDANPMKYADDEITDHELLLLMGKSGAFAFLDDEEEDIYTESDGTPLR